MTNPNSPPKQDQKKSTLEEVFQLIDSVTVRGVIEVACIGICILFLFITWVFPQLVIVVLLFLLLICFIAAYSFIYKANNSTWSEIVLDKFIHLAFGSSSHSFYRNLTLGDKIALAIRLNDRLKLISVCAVIISISLIILAAPNALKKAPITQSSTPINVALPTSVLASLTPQLSMTPSIATGISKVPIITTEAITSFQNLTQVPSNEPPPIATSIPAFKTPFVTASVNPVIIEIKEAPTQDAPTRVKEYQQLLDISLPRVVIAEVKNYSETNIITGTKLIESDEYISVANYGDWIDMSGWYISDNQGHTYHSRNFIYIEQV